MFKCLSPAIACLHFLCYPLMHCRKTRHSCSRPLRTTGAWSSTLWLFHTSRAEREEGVKRLKKKLECKPDTKRDLKKGKESLWVGATGTKGTEDILLQASRHSDWGEKSCWQCLQDDDLYQWSGLVGLWMTVCVWVWEQWWDSRRALWSHWYVEADSTYALRRVWR